MWAPVLEGSHVRGGTEWAAQSLSIEGFPVNVLCLLWPMRLTCSWALSPFPPAGEECSAKETIKVVPAVPQM